MCHSKPLRIALFAATTLYNTVIFTPPHDFLPFLELMQRHHSHISSRSFVVITSHGCPFFGRSYRQVEQVSHVVSPTLLRNPFLHHGLEFCIVDVAILNKGHNSKTTSSISKHHLNLYMLFCYTWLPYSMFPTHKS